MDSPKLFEVGLNNVLSITTFKLHGSDPLATELKNARARTGAAPRGSSPRGSGGLEGPAVITLQSLEVQRGRKSRQIAGAKVARRDGEPRTFLQGKNAPLWPRNLGHKCGQLK